MICFGCRHLITVRSECSLCSVIKNTFLLIVITQVSACDLPEWLSSEEIADPIIVLTRNAPTTYYYWRDGWAGLEYDLTQAFAEDMGVSIEYKVYDSIADILSALDQGEGHIAAAGLTRTEARQAQFAFSPSYQQIQQQVVCKPKGRLPKAPVDLTDHALHIIDASSYAESLLSLSKIYPELAWKKRNKTSTEQLLEEIQAGQLDCTITDSNIFAINRRYFPGLRVAMSLGEQQQLVWMLKSGDSSLRKKVKAWFSQPERQALLKKIHDRYYGFIDVFDTLDVKTYHKRINSRLPKYRAYFEAAAKRYSIDWRLLAAQSYQESHWNPRAKSPTGVRGMMMLTLTAAREVKVKNRLDVAESIRGGAEYYDRLLKRIPDSVDPDDRVWFALAAYNVGFGHLMDARQLAIKLNKNPDQWHDVKEVLPLLAQKQYYKSLSYGYARGKEPVRYVQRIQQYYHILVRHDEK